MKKKQLINEIMGVPKAVNDWVNYLASVALLLVDEIIVDDKWEARTVEYKGEDYGMYQQGVSLSGKEVMKLITSIKDESLEEFIKSDTFQQFPLYNPELTVELTVFPEEIYEGGNMSKRMEASQGYTGDISDVKLRKLGKVTIFSRNSFNLKVNIPYGYIQNKTSKHEKDLFNSLIPTLGHELTHSYQTFKQMEGGKPNIGFGRETMLNMMPQKMKYGNTPSWNYFLHVMYLHLSFELNARVTELYYILKRSGVNTKEGALKFLTNSEVWKDYKMLKDFDAEKFIEDFEYELPPEDPISELIRTMSGGKIPKPPKDKKEVIVSLIDEWNDLIQQGQKHLTSFGLDIPYMVEVPQKAKENPIEFFKFFEKRFHKKAEKLRRKLIKVISLVLEEANTSKSSS